jgi:sugar O-acyltransferase (sialic acid O-acetyltransferase NeuD family)|tara:strand:- start:123 stop:776 length:654 start_codon:yes stop_codon:yes gene_type:complete
MESIILFGAGGHSSKLIQIISQSGCYELEGYISTEKKGEIINNYPVIGKLSDYMKFNELHSRPYHIGIGENSVRNKIYNSVNENNHRLVSLISDRAVINKNTIIGKGTSIMNSVVIENGSHIGKCVIIDTGSVVEHHVVIEDFVNISPGAIICGKSTIKRGAILGAGSTIIEKITIGENSLVGAGSVVTSDIEPNSLVVGNPARVVKERNFKDLYLK